MSKQPDAAPRKALGRGLSALLPTRASAPQEPTPTPSVPGGPLLVALERIEPNPLQPRTVFQPEKLQELADSIQEHGLLQPVLVQQKGERYQLIAGERRWRAAELAGLAEIPVIVRETVTDRLLEMALVENIQREDLNPIEVAQAMERLGRELGLSHEEIGRRTGKDRTTITNLLRLLRLPETVQLLVAEQRLSMGHARALLGLPGEDAQVQLAMRVVDEGLSVRQVERIVQAVVSPKPAVETPESTEDDPNVRAAIQDLERVLGTRVRIVGRSGNKGRIEIDYFSQEELDRLYGMLTGR